MLQTLITTLTSTAALSALIAYFAARTGAKASINSAIISGKLQAESAIDQIELQTKKERSIFLLKEQTELYSDVSEWMHDLEVYIDDVIADIYESDRAKSKDARSMRMKVDDIPWGSSRPSRAISRRMYLLSDRTREALYRAINEFTNLHNPAQGLINDKHGPRPDSPILNSEKYELSDKERESRRQEFLSSIHLCKIDFYKKKNELFRFLAEDINQSNLGREKLEGW
ncbi:MAG TPA: hypothetical protein H9836_13505 [Candidatus Nocardiopsis merdipullorum]|nr:hypothetical protein [Candidatus Nocardiopsis merdipullorum]